MSFQEKSAWVMLLALMLTAALYFYSVLTLSTAEGLAPPLLPTLVVYTVVLVVIAIVGHIAAALMAPKEANAAVDEREKQIADRAESQAGRVMGFLLMLSLLVYLFTYSGHLLFYSVFASLIIGQVAEYLLQIFYFRYASL
ncbi:hypothetical protein [Gilvimarinus sp. DA14]|uniref:hypothetical protein n=1 Tax=Gilvimarinus sp. DA14 TaxID=2956798 RepID=UPI0020B86E4D|nr:hypothetical protein [Gilvimarinus sp. DA14]UTF58967.1 hypothetical protein NHM04_10810 [Gilvimarinus sp. DA14]